MPSAKSERGVSEILISKFDAYDAFGYLIPGAVFFLGICALTEVSEPGKMLTIKKDLLSSDNTILSWPVFISAIPVFLLLVYILGHFVASVSAILIDKLIIERMLGYPIYRLFKSILKYEKYPVLRYAHRAQQFYKSLFVLLVATAVFATINTDRVYFIVSIIVFFVVLVLKVLFSMLYLEDLHDPTSVREENTWQMRMVNCIWKTFCWILWPLYGLVFPIGVYSVLSLLFRMCKPFEEVFQEKFAQKFKDTFDIPIEKAYTNIYWLTYSYLHQNDKNSANLIQHWLNLYAFARNLSTSFFLLFLYGVCLIKLVEDVDKTAIANWCIGIGMCSIIFWLRYYYLYYNYYSKYLFRAFVSLKQES